MKNSAKQFLQINFRDYGVKINLMGSWAPLVCIISPSVPKFVLYFEN